MRILIIILSAHCFAERRASVRQTWLTRLPPNMTARFVVGDGPKIEEPDVWQVPAGDNYFNQDKLRLALRYAVGHGAPMFDYLFKCDDDTYLVPERLESAITDVEVHQPHYIGRRCGINNDYCHGGAGYLLSRWMVCALCHAPATTEDSEDGWVGLRCRAVTALVDCQRFCDKPTEWPTQRNDLITTHQLRTPELMFQFHARYLCPVPLIAV